MLTICWSSLPDRTVTAQTEHDNLFNFFWPDCMTACGFMELVCSTDRPVGAPTANLNPLYKPRSLKWDCAYGNQIQFSWHGLVIL